MKTRTVSRLGFVIVIVLPLMLASGGILASTAQAQAVSVGTRLPMPSLPSAFIGGYSADSVSLPNPLAAQSYKFVRQVGAQPPAGQFNQPSSVAVDASGNVFVVDQSNQRIQKFAKTGKFSLQWGG
jgi:NHL repeat